MANTFRAGNRFQRIQTPPYFIANNRPFWPSLSWESHIQIEANDPLHITRPVLQPEMVPLFFFSSELDGLLVDTIFAKYLGPQSSANTLFIYLLRDSQYFCIGSIALPISLDALASGNPLSLSLPPVLLGSGPIKNALRLEEVESIYLGIAQELTSPIVVGARGQRYSKLEKISASLGTV